MPDECGHVDGTEYVEYSERQTNTRTGAELRNIRSVKPKVFTTQDGPVERNAAFVYKIYREKRPNSVLTVEALFYLSINYSKNSDKCWFKTSAVRLNKLNLLMRTMANKAKLDEKRRLTNQSARKTNIQKLNDRSVPLTHTVRFSGHHNVQGVNNYISVSKQ